MSRILSICLLIVIFIAPRYILSQTQIEKDAIKNSAKQHFDNWNKRNLDSYLNDYWRSDSLLVLGEEGVIHGYVRYSKLLKESFSQSVDMGKMSYDFDSFIPFDNGKIMVIGTYKLDRGYDKISGAFLAIWAKKDGKWVIILEHSS